MVISLASTDEVKFSDAVFKTAARFPKSDPVNTWGGFRVKNLYDNRSTD